MKTMSQRILQASLQAAVRHQALGHSGVWRQCSAPACRDAQNYIPFPFKRDLAAERVSA